MASPLAAANAVALAATLGCNAAWQRRMRGRVRALDTDLSPCAPAFGIWLPIYALLAVTVAVQFEDAPLRAAMGGWFLASLACSVGWLAAVSFGPLDAGGAPARRVRLLAAALLLGAFATAAAAVLRAPPPDPARPAQALARAGLSLYAGWLAVAAALGVLSASGGRLPSPAHRQAAWGALALALGAPALALRDPLLVAPLGWAALWRAARGDREAAMGGALAWAAALAARR